MENQPPIVWMYNTSLGHLFSRSVCLQVELPVETLCLLETWSRGNASAIDAFSRSWKGQYFYAFPPFSLVNRVLQKVQQDQSRGILIVPMWTTQAWFPMLLRPLTDHPLVLPKGPRPLTLPFNQDKVHPLQKTLILLAWKLSGNPLHQKAFRKKLPKSYYNPGDGVHTNSTPLTSTNGYCYVLQFKGFSSIQSHSDTSSGLYDRTMWTRSMNTVRFALL